MRWKILVGLVLAALVSVVAAQNAGPLTVRLLREYVPRWEARGLRLVPVSYVAR